jgi:hypothetical protein
MLSEPHEHARRAGQSDVLENGFQVECGMFEGTDPES